MFLPCRDNSHNSLGSDDFSVLRRVLVLLEKFPRDKSKMWVKAENLAQLKLGGLFQRNRGIRTAAQSLLNPGVEVLAPRPKGCYRTTVPTHTTLDGQIILPPSLPHFFPCPDDIISIAVTMKTLPFRHAATYLSALHPSLLTEVVEGG